MDAVSQLGEVGLLHHKVGLFGNLIFNEVSKFGEFIKWIVFNRVNKLIPPILEGVNKVFKGVGISSIPECI